MQPIQWFPGHMNKTRIKMKEFISRVGLVVEILDARIPLSSTNPLINSIFKEKPRLLLLNKADLADPVITNKWLAFFERKQNTRALAINSTVPQGVKKVIPVCLEMGNSKGVKLSALISGVPNSGKSSFINAAKKERKTGVQNKPGFTKDFQRVSISDKLDFIDSPGLLWKEINTDLAGINLAICGSIKDSVVDIISIAGKAAEFLKDFYPGLLKERFKLNDLPEEPHEIIEQIGRKRGFLIKGGTVDYDRAAALLINELRNGKLGRFSLERPETGS